MRTKGKVKVRRGLTRLEVVTTLRLAVLVLGATLSLGPISASHTPVGRCDLDGGVALGIITISDGTAAHTVYVDDRNHLLGNGLWIYQETNGIFTPYEPVTVSVHDPGPPHVPYWWMWVEGAYEVDIAQPTHNLQRGGVGPLNDYIAGGYEDTCVDDPNVDPDTLIF